MIEQYRKIISDFVIQLINETTHRLGNNFLVYLDGQQLNQINHAFQNPLQSPIGQQLDEIARAACGLMADDDEGFNRGTVYEGIQDLMEQLFAPPGLGAAYRIPQEFWETELGQMVGLAWAWCRQDELITQARAAEIAGITTQAINQAIRDGRIRGYTNPGSEYQRQGKTLVSKADVIRLWGTTNEI